MKRNTIIIILTSILLIALAYFTIYKGRNSALKNEFLLSDTATVEKIFLVDKNNSQVTLTKENGIWKLANNEDAIQQNVEILLKTMILIDIRRPVSKSAFNTIVKQLATNSTKVEIYQRKFSLDLFGIQAFPSLVKTMTFYVGSPTRDYKGTIMKSEKSDDIYITYLPGFNGYLTERFSANYADWVNHSIYKAPLHSILKVRIEFGETPEQSYEVHNIGNRKFDVIKLYDNTTLSNYDTLRLLEELASYKSINFEALLDDMPAKRIDSIQNTIPFRTISVTNLAQQTKSIRMYRRPNYDNETNITGKKFPYDMDRMYAFVDGLKYPVTVQYFVMDNVSRTLDFIQGYQDINPINMKGFNVGNAPNP